MDFFFLFKRTLLALFIQKLLSGECIVLVNQIGFNGGVVRVFITIRLFKSLATTSNCMSQICGLWLNNAAALATEAICLSVAIQFTQNFLSVQPECGQGSKFVKEFRPELLGVFAAGVEVPCKLVEVVQSTTKNEFICERNTTVYRIYQEDFKKFMAIKRKERELSPEDSRRKRWNFILTRHQDKYIIEHRNNKASRRKAFECRFG